MVGRKPDLAIIVLHRIIDDIAAQAGGTGISGEMGKDTGGRAIAPRPCCAQHHRVVGLGDRLPHDRGLDVARLIDHDLELAIARDDHQPMVEMSLDSLHDRTYPLYMEIYLYVLQKKAEPLKPAVREFLKFVLSRDGQQAVANDAKWIPLNKAVLEKQLAKVNEAGGRAK